MSRSIFGNTFDRVVVINLDRRADRMSSVREQLAKLGVGYSRHPATDGKDTRVVREWQEYLAQKPVNRGPTRPVTDWRDFYLGDKPSDSRVAFFETERKSRGLSTPGAWGLFRSMRRVIEKALQDKVESLLILEDDVRFHRDIIDLWPKVKSELPNDWEIFQLGAMQLHWEDNWIKWHSQHLYKCQGSSFAAHAVALRRPAMQAVMERSKVLELPFDIGPLQEAKRLFRDNCYTAYPNLVIQDPKDSEIGMSKIFDQEAKKKINLYRWNWEDYDINDLRAHESPLNGERKNNNGPATQSSERFLQPYFATPGSVERVIVVFGPENDETAEAFVKMLKAQKEGGDVAPIVLIDELSHIPVLREAELAFEYIPSEETYAKALLSDCDPRTVIERRLSILRRKWLPRRIIALGEKGHARLETWRASPFEQAEFDVDLASDSDFRDAIK